MMHCERYAEACGWALARAHARSGDAAMIAGYMGSSRTFDEAICDFAVDYADQAERDSQGVRQSDQRRTGQSGR